MIINNINLVELIAEGDNYLTDTENTDTFKKITCREEEIANYIEVSKEKAEEIMLAIIEKAKDMVEDLVDKYDDVLDYEK